MQNIRVAYMEVKHFCLKDYATHFGTLLSLHAIPYIVYTELLLQVTMLLRRFTLNTTASTVCICPIFFSLNCLEAFFITPMHTIVQLRGNKESNKANLLFLRLYAPLWYTFFPVFKYTHIRNRAKGLFRSGGSFGSLIIPNSSVTS